MEEWLPVVGYEARYEVSNRGRVRNVVTGTVRVLTFAKTGRSAGYRTVDWKTNGKKEHFKVHHLVLEAFVSPRPNGWHGLHRNDDKSDNSVENLYWGTRPQNMQDKVRNGNHHAAKRTHCPRCGMELAGENIRMRKGANTRDCRTCRRHNVRLFQGYYLNHPDDWPDWAGQTPSRDALLYTYRRHTGRAAPLPPRNRVY